MNFASAKVRAALPSRRARVAVLAAAGMLVAGGGFTAGAVADGPSIPKSRTAVTILPAGQANPSIANGVAFAKNVALYNSSGIGPSGLNTAAPAGTPERYIDTAIFPGGVLPQGVTVTEAQAINNLRRIGENLSAMGLTFKDVVTMRVFLDAPPGAARADYAGWNRAYRQYFANTNVLTGATINVPLGTAPAAPPFFVNPTRVSRSTLEVASLAVEGWLIEIEVDAVYPR
ncbi:Rid family hydrolase [Motilibacter deserti]|nr:Rid family hydrolase [Motilibacter deserti]